MKTFYEEDSKLLTPGAFEFVLESELKRAVRSQNYLTLVTVEATRESEGTTVNADDGTMKQVAQIIGKRGQVVRRRVEQLGLDAAGEWGQ